MAKLGETLDMTEPPSEAFDRREVVALSGETVEHGRRMLLPIIRYGMTRGGGGNVGMTRRLFATMLERAETQKPSV